MNETIKTYNKNFKEYIQKTPNENSGEHKVLIDTFIEHVGGDKKVFEFGSAFGRDSRYMRDKGLNVVCSDIIVEGIDTLKKEGFTAVLYDFRDELNSEWVGTFDGVLARAVFLHAKEEEFPKILSRVNALLKPGGVFELSLKEGSGEEIETEKLGGERYFKYYKVDEVVEYLEKAGFTIVDQKTAEEGKWLYFIVKKK